jgi:DNA-directed RNA polymerase subunit M/transcription elongation factor TFIIS
MRARAVRSRKRGASGPYPNAPPDCGAAQITHVVPTHSKEVDDVLGGEEAWKNVDATSGARPVREQRTSGSGLRFALAAVCPKCSHNKAFFMQVQIRSGDEPMTTFYKARAPGSAVRRRRLSRAPAAVRCLQAPVARGMSGMSARYDSLAAPAEGADGEDGDALDEQEWQPWHASTAGVHACCAAPRSQHLTVNCAPPRDSHGVAGPGGV